jgi:hypothetical protein
VRAPLSRGGGSGNELGIGDQVPIGGEQAGAQARGHRQAAHQGPGEGGQRILTGDDVGGHRRLAQGGGKDIRLGDQGFGLVVDQVLLVAVEIQEAHRQQDHRHHVDRQHPRRERPQAQPGEHRLEPARPAGCRVTGRRRPSGRGGNGPALGGRSPPLAPLGAGAARAGARQAASIRARVVGDGRLTGHGAIRGPRSDAHASR